MDLDLSGGAAEAETEGAGMARALGVSGPAADGAAPDKNWAKEERVVQRLRNELMPLMREVKQRRQTLNDQWDSLMKVWLLEHENPGYQGDSKLYMPAGYKGIETMVAQMVSVTFPSAEPFSVRARIAEGQPFIDDVRTLQSYRLKQAQLRLKAERFYRQLLIKGTSVGKVFHRKKVYKKKRRAVGTFEPESYSHSCDGPTFEPFSVNNYYIFPEDAASRDDITLEFEEMTKSMGYLRQKARAGVYLADAVERSVNARSEDKQRNSENAGQGQGFTSPHNLSTGVGLIDIAEVYMDFDPKAASYGEEEEPVPFLITVCLSSGEVLRAIENPLWDQRSPYLVATLGALVERFYGQGPMFGVQQLNRLLNDQTNQSVDCVTYALNPIMLVNRNLVDGVLPSIEPGVPFSVHDVNQAVKFQTPPMEPVNVANVVMAQTASWIQEYIGAPPVLSGGSAPGRAFRSATGVSTAQTNAQIPLSNAVAHCEEAVWTPMLEMFWAIDQQMTDEEVLVPLTGNAQFKRIDPKQVPGDYLFEWEAVSHFEKSQLRASQLTQALGILTAPATVQALQMQGKGIDPTLIIKKLMVDVFGLKNGEEVLTMAPVMPPQPGAPQPGAPEQAPAGNPLEGESPMLAENPEFADVRTGANEMASLMGGMGAFNGGGEQ